MGFFYTGATFSNRRYTKAMSIITRCADGVCVCVLPMERNDYRPLALRHRALAFVSTLLIIAKVLTISVVALTPATAELSTITAARITELTNAERVSVGLNAMTTNGKLTNAAATKAQDMLDNDYFAHISPSGVTPWFWMSKEGYAYQVAGENLAIDFIEAEAVVAAWIASPSHKDNLLHTAYTETGIAVATGEFQGGTSTIVVHMFGLPTVSTNTQAPATATPTPIPAVVTTPAATATPTPTPVATATPAPVPTDTTAPRTPRIARGDSSGVVQSTVLLTITGEPDSIIHLLINNQERVLVNLPTSGKTTQLVDVSGVSDGLITVRAYATDAANNISATSAPLSVTKDSTPPLLATSGIYALLSPQSDNAQLALYVGDGDTQSVQVQYGEDQPVTFTAQQPVLLDPLVAATVVLNDHAGNASPTYLLSLAPNYQHEADTSFTRSPGRFSQGTRIATAAVFVIVLFLLSLAIIIRFSVQRPALITHASLVLLLAVILILW